MNGVYVFLGFIAVLLYVWASFAISAFVQDWLMKRHYPGDVAIPAIIQLTLLIGLPMSLSVGLLT